MKKFLLFLMVLALLLPSLAFAAHTEYVKNPTGRTVNVRRGPGKGYTVDYELKPGTKVTVESIEGKWTRISAPVAGWMMSRYLTDNPGGKTGGVIASTMKRWVKSPNGKKVNARTGPSTTGYAVAAQLEPGTEVDLLATMKDWSMVSCNGFTVYIMSKYLTADEKTAKSGGSSSFASFEARVYSPNGKKVNFRVSPDLKADRIFQLEPWTHVTVIGQSGSWYKVEYGASIGYMMKKYVRK